MAVALFVFEEAILAESAAHEHSAWDVVVSTISLFVPSHQLQNLWQQIPLYVPETVHQRQPLVKLPSIQALAHLSQLLPLLTLPSL